jgi:hypothetical protein
MTIVYRASTSRPSYVVFPEGGRAATDVHRVGRDMSLMATKFDLQSLNEGFSRRPKERTSTNRTRSVY